MKIAMANDHAGTALKNQIKAYLEEQGHEVKDFGTYDEEGCDLSDFVYPSALAVAKERLQVVLIHDRASISPEIMEKIKEEIIIVLHTDSNVLCIGGKIIGSAIAMEIVKTWMKTEPLTAEKYRRRVKKVADINDKHCVPVK